MICNILMCICPKDFALQNPTVLGQSHSILPFLAMPLLQSQKLAHFLM